MALFLDERYILISERTVRWLPRAYDGWDRERDRPVTAGYYEPGESLPVLPVTIRLQHPNIVGVLDLRRDEDGGTWVIWDYLGPAGADLVEAHPAPAAAAMWMALEVTRALQFARESTSRPGGFRIGDFGPDQIRLFEDGSVRVAGFGRVEADRDDAGEFALLGLWARDWLTESRDSDEDDADLVPGSVLGSLQLYSEADLQPHSVVPRILTGMQALPEGGEDALAGWLLDIATEPTAAELEARLQVVQAHPSDEDVRIATEPAAPETEADRGTLPPVRIAPRKREPREESGARTHKGLPLPVRSRVPLLIAALLLILIVVAGWRFGVLFGYSGFSDAPQILLNTAPSDARVLLDDSLLEERTPVELNDLPAGWHRVRFEREDFPPIEDSFLVYKESAHRPLAFEFTRTIQIGSRPAGASIYLNGKRAATPTPFRVSAWPVTEPLSLVMHLDQYGSLEDCLLDPVYGTIEVKDPAAWKVETKGDTVHVVGLFVHSVAFYVSPPDCRLTIDDTLPADPTGGTSYALTFGRHRVRASAVGFDPLDTTVVISSQTRPIVPLTLTRPVRIQAFDPSQPGTDLRALIDRLEGPDRALYLRRFTPYSVRIPAVAYTVTLRKRDYRDTTIYLPPDVTSAAVAMTPVRGARLREQGIAVEERTPVSAPAAMEPALPRPAEAPPGSPRVQIVVTAPHQRSLAGAEIWARGTGTSAETYLGTTDDKGRLTVQLAAGNYDLLAYLDLLSGVRKRVKIRPSRNRPIEIDLNP